MRRCGHLAKIMAGVAAPSEDSTAIIDFIHGLPKNLGVLRLPRAPK
jgi:hypothetical protein